MMELDVKEIRSVVSWKDVRFEEELLEGNDLRSHFSLTRSCIYNNGEEKKIKVWDFTRVYL